jgi:hypothetical protein
MACKGNADDVLAFFSYASWPSRGHTSRRTASTAFVSLLTAYCSYTRATTSRCFSTRTRIVSSLWTVSSFKSFIVHDR